MKKKNRLIRVSYLLALFIALGLGIEARAATVTAIASGQWTAAAATVWSTGAIPADGDDIIIPTGITVDIEASPATAPKTITIEGTGSLRFTTGVSTLNVATTAAGGIYVNGTSATAFTVNGIAAIINVGNATYRGDITNTSTGTITLSGAAANLTVSGTITNGDDATISTGVATILNFIGSTDCSVPSDITAANNLTVNKTGASVSLNAGLTLAGTLTMTSGTLVVGNNALVAPTVVIESGATLDGSATVTSARTFATSTTLKGTAVMNLSGTTTNSFSTALILGNTSAGSILNLEGSTTTINPTITFTNSAIVNAKGASLTYNGGATDFSNATLQTNLNTNLVMNASVAVVSFPAITELKNFTVNTTIVTLTNNLTLSGDLSLGDMAATALSTGGFNLTVNGSYTNNGAATTRSVLTIGVGTLTLNGPVTDWGVDQLSLVTGAGTLVIGGSGALPALLANTAAATDHGTVIMNRPGANLSFAAELLGAVSLDALTITAGTVTAPAGGISFTVAGACAVGANGTLVTNGCALTIFIGAVSGTGTITANAATDDLEFRNATFTFSGTLSTLGGAAGTVIKFTTTAITATLPSSVTALENLFLTGFAHVITLSNDLTINTIITPGTNWGLGTIIVNGYNLTLTGGIANVADAARVLDARNSSTITLGAASNFTGIRVLSDETTNIALTGAATTAVFNTNATSPILICKNLTIGAAATATLTAGMTIYGNVDVLGTFVTGNALSSTIYGDVSNSGIMTLTGSTLYLYGQMTTLAAATTTTTVATSLYIKGTGAQFSMPAGVGPLLNLYVDRANGVKLNNDLTIGAAATNGLVTLNKGNLDLNGYIVTLAYSGGATAQLSEVAGYHVINTGASSATTGYITTATLGNIAIARAEASGIGTTGFAGAANVTVKRYVKSTPITGVGISTARSYRITADANVTAVNLYFDNTELNSPATGLKLYFDDNDAFTSPTEVSGTAYPNTPTGKGYIAFTGINVQSDDFYTLSGLPGTGGVLYTYTGATGGNWSTASNWSPNGVPTSLDQVSINGPLTVYLNGTGSTFECNKLILSHNAAKVAPYNNAINGDIVNLRVLGNVTVNSGEILGVNGFGRLNLIIGDGTTAGVSSVISTPCSYVNGQGIWVNDLTVNSASVTTTALKDIRISGNLALVGNSSMVLEQPIFYGNNLAQTISVVPSAYLKIGTSWFTNTASVTTTSNLEIAGTINVAAGSSFIANNGLAIFPTAAITCWNVQTGATLRLNNVEFNAAAGTYAPLGIVEIQGSFTKSGASAFTALSGNVLFKNTSQKQLVNSGNAADLRFYDLTVFTNSSVATSSSFEVADMIDVKTGASLTGDNGTISFTQAAPATKWIKNASDHTLEFYNLSLGAGTTTTIDSWKIKGNLTSVAPGGSLLANNGTITFLNTQSKTIDNGGLGSFSFHKLMVADASTVVTAAAGNGDILIGNNATYLTGSGIEVAGTGSFTMASDATLTFDAAVGVTTGYPKVITKSSAGTLKVGLMVINASPANDVTTASDFTIIGTGSGFTNNGAGGTFSASAGTVTFSGTSPVIANVSPGESSFFSVKTIGATVLTQTTAQAIHIKGNITTDEQSKFVPGAAAKIYLDGSAQQILGGSSSIVNPIQLDQVVLDKGTGANTTNDEVLLQADVSLSGAFTLTNGVFNLGSKKFTNGAITMSRTNGVINGGTGTYVITTGHESPLLEDAFFMVGGVPTLYNLQVDANHTTANDLTINGGLNLNLGNLLIATGSGVTAPKKVTVMGNLSRVNGAINFALGGAVSTSRLVLAGTGTVIGGLSNTYFAGGAATTVQLEVARAEVLGGNLTIATPSYLLVNTGINDFDLGANTLTFATTFNLNVISGGIKAGLNSTFVIPAAATLPASTFRNNEVYNITLNGDLTLTSDLQINGVWTNTSASDVITGDNNVLTIGQIASLPVLSSAAYIKGNMARFVTSTSTPFYVGDAAQYYPVNLQFSTIGSSQLVRVYARNVDPVIGRGGNAKNSVNAQWTMVPQGTEVADSLKVTFQWPSNYEYTGGAGQVALANSVFPAKWEATYWKDYRNNLNTFAVTSPRVLTMSGFPVANPSALNGVWALFAAAANTTVEKDRAIATSGNKIVITSVDPSPTKLNQATKVTVQLQNQYGQPVLADTTFNLTLKVHQGASIPATLTNVIAKGSSMATFSGVTFTSTPGNNTILIADTTGGSANWQPITSSSFVVMDADPATQASLITFTNVEATSMTVGWATNGTDPTIIVMKADTLLLDSEFPVDGVTYDANSIYGAGSSIGNAIVAYKGAAATVNVTGLAPNTKYYVYAFSYKGAGYENYRTTATSNNPNAKTTTGTSDDDVTYGTNDTRSTSKTIGTNTPVTGTMKSSSDADWFNFTLTGASPNLRAKLYNVPGNYTLELYDMTGRRIRRSTLNGTLNEAMVVNNLTPGTYTVKIFSQDGSYWTKSGDEYKLKVSTFSSEIFSVTP